MVAAFLAAGIVARLHREIECVKCSSVDLSGYAKVVVGLKFRHGLRQLTVVRSRSLLVESGIKAALE